MLTDPVQAAIAELEQPPLPQPPVFSDVAAERRHRKERLAAAFRIFGRAGHEEGGAGHITVRDPERPDCFWVNPFGVSFRRMTVSDLVLVDHAGHLVEGSRPINAAAFAIHSEVHRARPDVVAAAHAHTVHGKAWASLGKPLEPISQDHCYFYEDHALYDDFNGVVLDVAEGRNLAGALGTKKAAILQNHGILTVGQSVDEAAYWFMAMDRCCHVSLLAEAAGKPISVPHERAKATHDQIGTHFLGWFFFQPLYDVVVAEEPDFLD
ncbi:MAG: class II aldolase/adducin family protein [Candidatus Elarobacter sp.]